MPNIKLQSQQVVTLSFMLAELSIKAGNSG